MVVYTKLLVPSFDLKWVSIENVNFVLVPGGGGSTKSGLKNCIQIFGLEDKILSAKSVFETNVKGINGLCFCLSYCVVDNLPIVCGLTDKEFFIGKLILLNSELSIEPLATGESPDDSTMNVCAFSFLNICTAGDDGMLRIWNSSDHLSSSEKTSNSKLKVIREIKCHNKAVVSISPHCSRRIIATASKDGSCKLWNVSTGAMLCDFAYSYNNPNAKIECRGCCLSGDNILFAIYSVQIKKQTTSLLAQWSYEIDQDLKLKEIPSLKRKRNLGIGIATKLVINDTNEYLSVGMSDGVVKVVRASNFYEVFSKPCHHLPVTGIEFLPESVCLQLGQEVGITTCSADNALTLISVSEFSTVFQVLISAFYVIVILAGIISMILMFRFYSSSLN